jgi:MtrB/PioB family decaheme-associated outer membrane protein
MRTKFLLIPTVVAVLGLPAAAWAQEEAGGDAEAEDNSIRVNEVTAGFYYMFDGDSYRYGKYSGLTEEGGDPLVDLLFEKRPDAASMDTVRWRLQGWRLGLDSRRLEFVYHDQGKQKFRFDYRQIPNNRIDDGLTPYRRETPGLLQLAPDWEVLPGTSNTLGFIRLEESLARLRADSERRWLELDYDRRLGDAWALDFDFRHETKEGTRTLGSVIGYTGSNARSVILGAPIDWTTDIAEAMFRYSSMRAQFGVGVYASFFSNSEESFTFQNAYGYRNGWAPGVAFPEAYGRLALEPDNSYVQLKAYGGLNFGSSSRLTADLAYGKMRQDDALLPYSVNPELVVHTPLPLSSLDAEVNTTMLNLRYTAQLAQRLGLAVNYHYDDRDNKTPRAVYPYIGGDAQNQRPEQDGRINLPYSYTRHKADAIATWRVGGGSRLKAGVEYTDHSRDYQEVTDSDETTWLAGFTLRGWSQASLSFDLRTGSRDVSGYTGNAPLLQSYQPGRVSEDDYANHPLLRKYYLTDRDRDQFRFRADIAPGTRFNLGLAGSYAEDDYDDRYFGLNEARVQSWTVDGGFHPREHMSLTGFYTRDKYDAAQSGRSFSNDAGANDPANNWFSDTVDRVDTWNVAFTIKEVGTERGWSGVEFGLDYTQSDTRSDIDVSSASSFFPAAPLPQLQADMRSFSIWGSARLGENMRVRLAAENAKLTSRDWALDGVQPDTLTNVLLLGESAANYDLWLISTALTFNF